MTPCFPLWEFKQCLRGRGWKASWTGWCRITGSEGQRRLYRFPTPVTLCSLILRLHHLTRGHPDCQKMHGLSLWPEPTLRMWLKSILLDPSLEVQMHPVGATQNNWISGPHGSSSNVLFHDVSLLLHQQFFPPVFPSLLTSKTGIENDTCMHHEVNLRKVSLSGDWWKLPYMFSFIVYNYNEKIKFKMLGKLLNLYKASK